MKTEYPAALFVAAAIVAAVLVFCVFLRAAFWSYGSDTGTFAVAISNAPSGMYDLAEHGSHFRYHWSPILFALYPLLLVARSIVTLQIVQVVAIVGSVFALYSLIVPHLGTQLALRVSLLALIYPPLIGLAFSEFHEVAFVPLLTFLLLLAADRRRWSWYALWAALLLCVREDIALILGCFGVALAFLGARSGRRDEVYAGGATALGVGLVMWSYFDVVAWRLGGWRPAHFYDYPYAAGPIAVAASLLTWGRLSYLLEIFVPLAFLPLRTRWALLAAPGLAVVVLANSPSVWRMGMHYVALWLPWVLVAAAAGAASLARKSERLALRWVSGAIATSLLFLIFVNPTHAAHYLSPSYHDLKAVREAFQCVPREATVATHDEWYTEVALDYPHVTWDFPPQATFAVYASDYPSRAFQTNMLPRVKALVASGNMRVICRFDQVSVYQRATPAPQHLPTITVHAPKATLTLQVATTEDQRETGLMSVTNLPAHTGMVFVFDQDAPVVFWMKDTLVPLDMVFVAADGTVRSVAANVPVVSEDTPDDKIPTRPGVAKYVIELPAGEAQKDGILASVRLSELTALH
ncbi:MAG TPA: DUF2079 domain-containing protein [Candidatus Acidoferrum sp.]|nr:DUF2079 domain-containing protein [Candidatus Acidoferrum sp.]